MTPRVTAAQDPEGAKDNEGSTKEGRQRGAPQGCQDRHREPTEGMGEVNKIVWEEKRFNSS